MKVSTGSGIGSPSGIKNSFNSQLTGITHPISALDNENSPSFLSILQYFANPRFIQSWQRLGKMLKDEGLLYSVQAECGAVQAFIHMMYHGMPIDSQGLDEMLARYKVVKAEIIEPFIKLFPTVNPGSNAQVMAAMNTKFKLKLTAVNDVELTGITSPSQAVEVAENLMLWRSISIQEAYLISVKEKMHGGRIRTHFRQFGPSGQGRSTSKSPNCLSGDTLICSPDGLKRIDSIKPGTMIQCSHGLSRVVDLQRRDSNEVFEISLEDGRSIKATLTHRFLTKKGSEWTEVANLSVGDAVYLSTRMDDDLADLFYPPYLPWPAIKGHLREKDVTIPFALDTRLAEMMGLFTADGCLGKSNYNDRYSKISICAGWEDGDVLERIASYAKDLFNKDFVHRTAKTALEINLNSTLIGDYFDQIGLSGGSHGKTVPSFIMNSPRKYQRAFLRGYFDGDGHNGLTTIKASSVNSKLLKDVQLLLSNNGIYSVISKKHVSGGFEGAPQQTLSISGKENRERFLATIGFLAKRKNQMTVLKKRISQTIPFRLTSKQLFSEWKNEERKKMGLICPYCGSLKVWKTRSHEKPAIMCKDCNKSKQAVFEDLTLRKSPKELRYSLFRGELTQDTVLDAFHAVGELPSLKLPLEYIRRGLKEVRITSIVSVGCEPVYDIEVVNTHEFIANGIVVCNSSYREQDLLP